MSLFCGLVAQLGEQVLCKDEAAGSTPVRSTEQIQFVSLSCSSMVEQGAVNSKATGSSPVETAK